MVLSPSGEFRIIRTTDGGRSWDAPVRLDDASSLGHVDVEMLDDGSAVATWVEFAEGRGRLRMRRVERSGAKSPAIEVSGSGPGRVSGYPRLARSGNDLLFTWAENTGASDSSEVAQQVRGAIARLPGVTGTR